MWSALLDASVLITFALRGRYAQDKQLFLSQPGKIIAREADPNDPQTEIRRADALHRSGPRGERRQSSQAPLSTAIAAATQPTSQPARSQPTSQPASEPASEPATSQPTLARSTTSKPTATQSAASEPASNPAST